MSTGLVLNATKKIGPGMKLWIISVFILSLTGLSVFASWVFNYGATTVDLATSREKFGIRGGELFLSGIVLTILSTIIMIGTLYYIHSNKYSVPDAISDTVRGG